MSVLRLFAAIVAPRLAFGVAASKRGGAGVNIDGLRALALVAPELPSGGGLGVGPALLVAGDFPPPSCIRFGSWALEGVDSAAGRSVGLNSPTLSAETLDVEF